MITHQIWAQLLHLLIPIFKNTTQNVRNTPTMQPPLRLPLEQSPPNAAATAPHPKMQEQTPEIEFKIIIYQMHMARQHQKRFLLTGQDKYSKITHRDKIMLIKRVIFDSLQIKETAQALNINYSTAKTLMRKFKKHGEDLDEEVIVGISRWYDIYCQERRRCEYRAIDGGRLRKNSKKQRRTHQEETQQHQPAHRTSLSSVEEPTRIKIYQQVLFRE